VLVDLVAHHRRLELRRGLAVTGRRSQHGHKSAESTEKTVELKLSHKALSVEESAKSDRRTEAPHQDMISKIRKISGLEYAPGEGKGAARPAPQTFRRCETNSPS
jgi:hypothetical protein